MINLQILGAKLVVIYKEKLVLVKQTRAGKSGPTFELPGGRIENGENSYNGAIRELREETGLIAADLFELGTYTIPGSPVVIKLWFTNSIVGEERQRLDIDEDIEVLYVDVDEAFRNVANGTWTDARLGIGLILARAGGRI